MRRIKADLDLYDSEEDKKHLKKKHMNNKPEGKSSSRTKLEILAALIFSNFGGNMSIQEKNGSLELTTPSGNQWKIKVEDGRVKIKGFPDSNNYEELVGQFKDKNFEASVTNLARKLVEKMQSAEDLPEPQPPLAFQGLNTPVDQPSQDTGLQPNLPPTPDQLSQTPPQQPSMGMPPPSPDMGMGAPPPMGMPPSNIPQTPLPDMGMTPPPQGAPPMGMPTASRRISSSLDRIANDIELAGYKELAERVDRISNTLERRFSSRGKPFPASVCTTKVTDDTNPGEVCQNYNNCVDTVKSRKYLSPREKKLKRKKSN